MALAPSSSRSRHAARDRSRSRLPAWLALLWSVTATVLALAWLAGVWQFPFVPPGGTLLHALPATSGQLLLLATALAGLGVSLAHVLGTPRSRLLSLVTLALPVVLILAIPDFRLLASVGYVPIMLTLVALGEESITVFAQLVDVPTLVLLGGVIAGVCFAVLARRSWPTGRSGPLSDRRLARLGHVATYTAAAVPVVYATTRIAWAMGIPLGLTEEFLRSVQPIVHIGLGLGLFALLGSVLTPGLVQRWGEVFPRWVPGLGGTPVPVGLAVNTALAVSVLVGSAGCAFVRLMAQGGIPMAPDGAIDQIGAWLPEMLWPLWGASLATAALCYRERRRRADDEVVRARALEAIGTAPATPDAP